LIDCAIVDLAPTFLEICGLGRVAICVVILATRRLFGYALREVLDRSRNIA